MEIAFAMVSDVEFTQDVANASSEKCDTRPIIIDRRKGAA
jgi:hypothetical protein